ncbi:MAG TPA: class I SAM-dependent methyltransferase [Thermoanaerobaculia bacterium]
MTALAEVMEPTAIDEDRLNELLGRFVNDMGAAMQAPLMIVGHELGLYRALAAEALTTEELADRTRTTERYVREWVRSQAAAGWVSYDAGSETYWLSAEQAILFDEEGPAFVIGGFEVAVAGGRALPRLLEAFRSGGGIGWHEHDPLLFGGTASFFASGYRANLVSNWIPALEGVEAKLKAGARVADVGCGHGISTLLMAERFPASSFVGFDYHRASVEAARENARKKGLEAHAWFIEASAKTYAGGNFDLITMFDALHDLGDPLGALKHARNNIAADGTLMLVEPKAGDSVEANLNPVGRSYYSASTIFCTPNAVSQDGGHALGAQGGVAAVRELAREAGFSQFRVASETPFNLVFEVRP